MSSATNSSLKSNDEPDILEKLEELARQASTEKSHYYVATVVGQAHREIVHLRGVLERVTKALK